MSTQDLSGGAFDFDTQSGIARLLASVRAADISTEDKNDLRDTIFLYTNGGRDQTVRISLEQKLNSFGIKTVGSASQNATQETSQMGFSRSAPSTFSVLNQNKTNTSVPQTPVQTPPPTTPPQTPPTPQPPTTPTTAPQPAPATPAAPVPPPVQQPTPQPAPTPNAAPVTPPPPAQPPVAPPPVSSPPAPAPTPPPAKPPVAGPPQQPAPAQEPDVPSAAPAGAVQSGQSPDIYLNRIKEIKSLVNEKVGNPVNLVDIDNEVGREYMGALLDAMKKINSGVSAVSAMKRLELAFQAVELAINKHNQGNTVGNVTPVRAPEPVAQVTQRPTAPTSPAVSPSAPSQSQPPTTPTTAPQPAPATPAAPVPPPVQQPTPQPAPTPNAAPVTPPPPAQPPVAPPPVSSPPAPAPTPPPAKPPVAGPPQQPAPAQEPDVPSAEAKFLEEKSAKDPIDNSKNTLVENAETESRVPIKEIPESVTDRFNLDEDRWSKSEIAAESAAKAGAVPKKPETVVSAATSQSEQKGEVDKKTSSSDPLFSPEVDDGLNQLLSEWSLFKKSGFLGTGPKGREHPLFKKIAGLQIPLLLAGRFEGATQEIKQSITDYMNGWRYEQGIVYNQGETFERYLRRVIKHILDLQKKRTTA